MYIVSSTKGDEMDTHTQQEISMQDVILVSLFLASVSPLAGRLSA